MGNVHDIDSQELKTVQLLHLFRKGCVSLTCNSANGGGVIAILHNRVLSMSGIAVMGVQHKVEGAKHTANWNCLGSVCEEVKYPDSECGTQFHS